MKIIMKRQRDGQSWRKHFYGQYEVDGKRFVVNTNVPWKGTAPESLRAMGDVKFERSRTEAEGELQRMVDEAQSKGRADHLTERLIKSKTGKAVEYVKIADLAARWRKMERRRVVSERHFVSCDAVFAKFAAFVQEHNPEAVFLYSITSNDAAAWLRKMQSQYSAKTVSEYHQLVRSAVNRFLPAGCISPFANVARGQKSDGETVHRKPFSADELQRLLETARGDSFMYPLVVTAACTGMRRGDVCKLCWDSVNLAEGVLIVKTSKSGANVEIPIFPPLMDVFVSLGQEGKGFVFPAAAAMLAANPTGLSWRFKTLVANALADKEPSSLPAAVSASAVVREAVEAINSNTADGSRRSRIHENFRRYADGQSLRDIEKDTGVARGVVSTDLADVERWIGKRFKRSTPGRHSSGPSCSIKGVIASTTRIEAGEGRCNAGSIRDWHALRATWVTLALSAGVPMELVRRVTGHATVEVVLQHYFRPGREQFRTILTDAMPDVLTGGKPVKAIDEGESSGGEMAILLAKIQNGTATTADKKRFKALAAKV